MIKNISIMMFCLVLILSGCVYQAKLRPEYNDTDIWICKNPYIELCWSKTDGHTGVIIYEDTQYDIIHEEDYGPLIWIYTDEATPFINTDVPEEYWVFKGHVNYDKDKLEIEVQQDFKNIFNGELPTLKFRKYNKEEYLKNKKE